MYGFAVGGPSAAALLVENTPTLLYEHERGCVNRTKHCFHWLAVGDDVISGYRWHPRLGVTHTSYNEHSLHELWTRVREMSRGMSRGSEWKDNDEELVGEWPSGSLGPLRTARCTRTRRAVTVSAVWLLHVPNYYLYYTYLITCVSIREDSVS